MVRLWRKQCSSWFLFSCQLTLERNLKIAFQVCFFLDYEQSDENFWLNCLILAYSNYIKTALTTSHSTVLEPICFDRYSPKISKSSLLRFSEISLPLGATSLFEILIPLRNDVFRSTNYPSPREEWALTHKQQLSLAKRRTSPYSQAQFHSCIGRRRSLPRNTPKKKVHDYREPNWHDSALVFSFSFEISLPQECNLLSPIDRLYHSLHCSVTSKGNGVSQRETRNSFFRDAIQTTSLFHHVRKKMTWLFEESTYTAHTAIDNPTFAIRWRSIAYW